MLQWEWCVGVCFWQYLWQLAWVNLCLSDVHLAKVVVNGVYVINGMTEMSDVQTIVKDNTQYVIL